MIVIDETVRQLLAVSALCWAALLVLFLLRPQRLFNSFFLLLTLGLTLFSLAAMFSEHTPVILAVLFALLAAAVVSVPFLLIWNGVVMLKKESFSLANLLSLLLGAAMLLAMAAMAVLALRGFDSALGRTASGLMLLGGLSVLYFSALMLTFVIYTLFMMLFPHLRRYDYIVIHGCSLIDGVRISRLLSDRVDKAIELFRRSRGQAYLIPSGGRGGDERRTEAEAMREYLLEKGIPDERILIEDQSTTTEENLRNSWEIIRRREGRRRVALVTSNYHVYRCLLLASSLGIRCAGVGAKVALYYWPSAVIREFAAVFTRRRYVLLTALGYYVLVILPLIVFLFRTA